MHVGRKAYLVNIVGAILVRIVEEFKLVINTRFDRAGLNGVELDTATSKRIYNFAQGEAFSELTGIMEACIKFKSL